MNDEADKLFEINIDDINVEEIMKKIKENIARRKAQGAYTKEDEKLINSALAINMSTPSKHFSDLRQELLDINNYVDIENKTYFISSHRKIIGPILVKGRQIVSGEIKRYVDPTIDKQKNFNTHIIHVINKVIEKNEELYNTLSSDFNNKINAQSEIIKKEMECLINKKIEKNEELYNTLSSDFNNKINAQSEIIKKEMECLINKKIHEIIAIINRDIENKAWLVSLIENRLKESKPLSQSIRCELPNINYVVFENHFRGLPNEIKCRQRVFLKYFNQCKNVLDIGCGRGEFLEILKENGIVAHGIDIDKDMIAYCKSRGLDVERSDAIEYLNNIKDESLDGIFIDQVVEHLESVYLIDLLKLCYRKLINGHYIVIETVNPLSFASMANFYIDLTHRRPVHPETLKFLMEYVGFRNVELKFFSPLPETISLKKIEDNPSFSDYEKKALEIYNQNIEKLNNILFGAQDYAIIGKK